MTTPELSGNKSSAGECLDRPISLSTENSEPTSADLATEAAFALGRAAITWMGLATRAGLARFHEAAGGALVRSAAAAKKLQDAHRALEATAADNLSQTKEARRAVHRAEEDLRKLLSKVLHGMPEADELEASEEVRNAVRQADEAVTGALRALIGLE